MTGQRSRMLTGLVAVVWAVVTVGLGAVGLVRFGELRGQVKQVEHKTTVIHDEVRHLELCSTAVTCRRLLDELIASATARQERSLSQRLGIARLRVVAQRIGRELAATHRRAAVVAPRRSDRLRRRVRRRSPPRRVAPVHPPVAAPSPIAPIAPAPPILNPAGHAPPGLNKPDGGPAHGADKPPTPGAGLSIELEPCLPECAPLPTVSICSRMCGSR